MFFAKDTKGVAERKEGSAIVELLLTTDIEKAKNFRRKGGEIATSIESARIRLQEKKYARIFYDDINPEPLFNIAYICGADIIPYTEQIKQETSKESKIFHISTVYEDMEKEKENKRYFVSKIYKPKKKVLTQEIVSFWAVKGGVGRTTIIKRLLFTIPEEIKTAVIDFNVANGGADLSFMLNLPPVPHLGLYFKNETKETLLENSIEIQKNKFVIQAPPAERFIKDIKEDNINRLISNARALFDLILIDLPNKDDNIIRTIIKYSTKTFIVTTGLISEFKRIAEKEIDCRLIIVNPQDKLWKQTAATIGYRYVYIDNINGSVVKVIDEIFD